MIRNTIIKARRNTSTIKSKSIDICLFHSGVNISILEIERFAEAMYRKKYNMKYLEEIETRKADFDINKALQLLKDQRCTVSLK